MTTNLPSAVFDCNIFVQALINLNGPAARCLQNARDGRLLLYISRYVLAEIREIYRKTPSKYAITAEQCEELAGATISFAVLITDVPEIYHHPYDPDDSHYINLAHTADARTIVSRDRHLLMLADMSRKEGRDFHSQFPNLRILNPVELLKELDAQSSKNSVD